MSVKNKDNIFLLKEEVKSYDNFIFENHLANPCKNLIDDIIKNLENYRNICSLLVSQMGAGKTKMIVEVLIPYLFEKTDVRLQIYTVPMNEIIDEFQFLENKPEDKQIIVVNKDARKAYSLLKRGYKRIMDKNLGRGYTEWYDCTGQQLLSCVLYAFNFLYNKDRILREKINTGSRVRK